MFSWDNINRLKTMSSTKGLFLCHLLTLYALRWTHDVWIHWIITSLWPSCDGNIVSEKINCVTNTRWACVGFCNCGANIPIVDMFVCRVGSHWLLTMIGFSGQKCWKLFSTCRTLFHSNFRTTCFFAWSNGAQNGTRIEEETRKCARSRTQFTE